MKIKKYIQDKIILPRLKKHGVFVVYDDVNHYRELCLELEGESTVVIDVSEGSIPGRERAIKLLQEIRSTSDLKKLLVYVPVGPPDTNQQKMTDPFWVYAIAGGHFPSKTSDEFQHICLAAKADYSTEIRKVFNDNPNPEFSLIDSIGRDSKYPVLQNALGLLHPSPVEIIVAMLNPEQDQVDRFHANADWLSDLKEFLQNSLGMSLQTQQESLKAVSDELWRFVLFSEFVFDLPDDVSLPESLSSVPRAIPEAQPFIWKVCEQLRANRHAQSAYIERAQEIEKILELPSRCEDITDLGRRDTFPFEERTFFNHCIEAIKSNDLDAAKSVLQRSKNSVWIGRGESQSQWNIIETAMELVERCNDCEREVSKHSTSLEQVVRFYVNQFYKVDQSHREFEHAVSDFFDLSNALHPVIEFARGSYTKVANDLHRIFVKHVESDGWPVDSMLMNSQVFDSHVGNYLKESGKKIAYFMIDALRYELGAELERELGNDGGIELKASLATIPTVTPIGMASLLPEAETKLNVQKAEEGFAVFMGDKPMKTVSNRMKWIEGKYGDRFKEIKLEQLLSSNFKKHLAPETELLVVRSNSVDSRMETEYQSGLPGIKRDMQNIRAAIHRLRESGFEQAIIVTDHGFCINAAPDIGDTCQQPPGEWTVLHDRCLLGKGSKDSHNWVCDTKGLGLASDYAQVGGPKSFACYTKNNQYFHGGASLQEAIVPVLLIELAQKNEKDTNVTYHIRYKKNSVNITTRLPVFELEAKAGDLFDHPESCEVLVQAIDKKGKVVGEPKPGSVVNAATGMVSLQIGAVVSVPVKMAEDFEGEFTLKIFDPATRAQLAELALQTDYMV